MKKLSFLNGLILCLFIVVAMSCNKDKDEIQEAWKVEVEQVEDATSSYIDFQNATNSELIEVSNYGANMGRIQH